MILLVGYCIILWPFLVCKKSKIMKSDEKRSHRLNYLLKCYLIDPQENTLYLKAKQMGEIGRAHV